MMGHAPSASRAREPKDAIRFALTAQNKLNGTEQKTTKKTKVNPFWRNKAFFSYLAFA